MNFLADALEKARARRSLPPPAMRALIRKQAGVSQGVIAEELGVSCAAICRYERGNRVPKDLTLIRYLEILKRLAEES